MLQRNRPFQMLSLQVDAGAVEPSFAAITTQLKRLGNSNFSTRNVVEVQSEGAQSNLRQF